jgi:hypothetical protein
MVAYVVKSWYADKRTNGEGRFVSIKGRVSGLLSWVMSLAGVSPTVSLECGGDKVVYEAVSWSGKTAKTIPVSKISSIQYGYSKPWQHSAMLCLFGFVVGAMAARVFGSPFAGFLVLTVFVACAALYYTLNKLLSIGILEDGGCLTAINFKRSVIEGIDVDENAAERVCMIIQAIVDRANSPHKPTAERNDTRRVLDTADQS